MLNFNSYGKWQNAVVCKIVTVEKRCILRKVIKFILDSAALENVALSPKRWLLLVYGVFVNNF